MSEDPVFQFIMKIKEMVNLLQQGKMVDVSGKPLLNLIKQVESLEKQIDTYLQETEKLLDLDQLEPGKRRELQEVISEKTLSGTKEAQQTAMELKKALETLRKENWQKLSKDKCPPGFLQGDKEEEKDVTEEERKKKQQRLKSRKDWKPM